MGDASKGEHARASREARDAAIARPRGAKGQADDEALLRYLSAETSYELHRLRDDSASDEHHSHDSRRDPDSQ